MAALTPIVEGHGEVPSFPLLVYRIVAHAGTEVPVDVRRPIRIPKSTLVRDEQELTRAVQLAGRQCGPDGLVIVMIDADDDCAAELGPELEEQVREVTTARVRVVLPVCEYEAWLLASASSLAGHAGLPADLEPPENPEQIRDAKGWIDARLHGREIYRETATQPSLTAELNVEEALETRSFRKLYKELTNWLRDVE